MTMHTGAVRERLIAAARTRELIHYAELAKMLGTDLDNPYFGAQVGEVIGQIGEDEVANGRPMLSAILTATNPIMLEQDSQSVERACRP